MVQFILPPIASQNLPDMIEVCTKLPVSISASPKIFLCFTFNWFTLICKERTFCNRLFLFTWPFTLHSLLLHLQTISPVIISFTENPPTCCCTSPAYPATSSLSSLNSEDCLVCRSSLVPYTAWRSVLFYHNFLSMSSVRAAPSLGFSIGFLQAVSFQMSWFVTTVAIPQVI